MLALRRAADNEVALNASLRQDRYSRSEVKYVSTVSVADIQKSADELAKNYRELDARVQELNWQTELV